MARPRHRSARWRWRILLTAVAVLLAGGITLFATLPSLVRYLLVETVADAGGTLTIEEISLQPLRGVFTLTGATLAGNDGPDLVLGNATLRLDWAALPQRTLRIEQFSVDGLLARLHVDDRRVVSMGGITLPGVELLSTTNEPGDVATTPGWQVDLRTARLAGLDLKVVAPRVTGTASIAAVGVDDGRNLSLDGLRVADSAGNYVNLGRLAFAPDDGGLTLMQLDARAAETTIGFERLDWQVDWAALPEKRLHTRNLRLSGFRAEVTQEAAAPLEIAGIRLPGLDELEHIMQAPSAPAGDDDWQYRTDAAELLDANFRVATPEFAVALHVDRGAVDADGILHVGTLGLADLHGVARRDQDDRWYVAGIEAIPVLSLLRRQSAPADDTAPGLGLQTIRVSGRSVLQVRDDHIEPPVRFNVAVQEFEVNNLGKAAETADANARFELLLDETTRISLSGTIARLQPGVTGRLEGRITGLPMPMLSPYMARHFGFFVDAGNADASLVVRIDDDVIDGTANVTAQSLYVSTADRDRLAAFEADLPVNLATATRLLTDDDGIITLDMGFAGKLGEPDFALDLELDAAINRALQAMTGLALLAITPVGAVIAAAVLAGGVDDPIDPVAFADGSSALGEREKAYLDEVAGHMRDRPAARIGVCGIAAPDEPPGDAGSLAALAEARAQAVLDYLRAADVGNPGRFIACRPYVDDWQPTPGMDEPARIRARHMRLGRARVDIYM